MHKLILLFLVLLPLSTSADSNSPTKELPKIGAIIGLSGSMSQAGTEMKRGMDIALEELEKGNQKPFEVVFEDDQSLEQKVAVSAISKLINLDKVKLVLNWANTTMPSITPIATRAKVPVIEFWDSNDSMFSLSPYVFCSGVSTEKIGALGARFAVQKNKNSKLAMIVLNDPWSELIADSFKKEALRIGAKMVFEERVDINEKDLRALALKLRKTGAEGVYLPLCMSPLYASVRQLKELGYEGDIYIADCMVEGDIKVLGKFGEGAYSHQFVIDDPAFIQKYSALHGTSPSNVTAGYAALGYDAIMIVKKVFDNLKEKNAPIESENIKNELDHLRYIGLTGVSVLRGSSEKLEDIVVIKDGKFEKIEFE